MCDNIQACAPSEYTPPKQPETGAKIEALVGLTVRQWNSYGDEEAFAYASTFQVTTDEARKLRDSLNALNL